MEFFFRESFYPERINDRNPTKMPRSNSNSITFMGRDRRLRMVSSASFASAYSFAPCCLSRRTQSVHPGARSEGSTKDS